MQANSTNSNGSIKCEFSRCEKPVHQCGLCRGHCQQKWKGKALATLRFRRLGGSAPVVRVKVEKSGCHNFTGAIGSGGYGVIRFRDKIMYVHRYIWERDVGPIPEGMVVDHKCRNRACCNPDHLRVVTKRVNALENSTSPIAANATKTHCPKGHEYSLGNTYAPHRGGRMCKICIKERQNESRGKAACGSR